MIGLGWMLIHAGGWARMLLISGCTAVASGLWLVSGAILNLPQYPQEYLVEFTDETGMRGVTAFVVAILAVPLLLLLYQAIRLGTAARERRFEALRVAGATPDQVRTLGAIEVGIPALAGGVLGIGVYALLRILLGGDPVGSIPQRRLRNFYSPDLTEIVPVSVLPTWWQFLVAVGGVAVAGCYFGWRASRRVVLTPLDAGRRLPAPPPRPWGLLALVLSPVPFIWHLANPTPVPPSAMSEWSPAVTSTLPEIISVALAVLGMVSLASWVAYRTGHAVERRANAPATLLAARRLIAEPRPAGRAAAAVGGIALVAGAAGSAGIWVVGLSPRPWTISSVATLVLMTLLLTSPLVAVTLSLSVHAVESWWDRKPELSGLVAAGASMAMLEKAQRREAALVAIPLAGAGLLLGSAAIGTIASILDEPQLPNDLRVLAAIALYWAAVLMLVWAALYVATRAVRPLLRRAADPRNLRTE